jgi:integration host factor subunit alpha
MLPSRVTTRNCVRNTGLAVALRDGLSVVNRRRACHVAGSGAQKRQGRKINNSDVDSAVLQSALAADLHRAMLVAKVRQEAEKDLPTLTKAELAELLFEQVGLNKREAKDMVETFFDEIRNALERGEAVKLSGFGNFQLRDKPQRPGRNPKTGEEIPITARRVVTFHASQKLKSMVEETSPLARAA